jgi:hypothetical protein
MTNNLRDSEKYIAVEGMDNAMEVAKVLLKNGYEVFVELDDCDIYCVHYAYAKHKGFCGPAFYRISEEDLDTIYMAEAAKEEE